MKSVKTAPIFIRRNTQRCIIDVKNIRRRIGKLILRLANILNKMGDKRMTLQKEIEKVVDSSGYCKFIPPKDKESIVYKNMLRDTGEAITAYLKEHVNDYFGVDGEKEINPEKFILNKNCNDLIINEPCLAEERLYVSDLMKHYAKALSSARVVKLREETK